LGAVGGEEGLEATAACALPGRCGCGAQCLWRPALQWYVPRRRNLRMSTFSDPQAVARYA
ncbi:hypothetical protein, partial [Enterobacter hormaechei]|uniref:hypothetical protein n=1 Tax=Enterobacter hormaechei TaxID=158836 RepID=UPI00200F268A